MISVRVIDVIIQYETIRVNYWYSVLNYTFMHRYIRFTVSLFFLAVVVNLMFLGVLGVSLIQLTLGDSLLGLSYRVKHKYYCVSNLPGEIGNKFRNEKCCSALAEIPVMREGTPITNGSFKCTNR